jgi:hypothetical protein
LGRSFSFTFNAYGRRNLFAAGKAAKQARPTHPNTKPWERSQLILDEETAYSRLVPPGQPAATAAIPLKLTIGLRFL